MLAKCYKDKHCTSWFAMCDIKIEFLLIYDYVAKIKSTYYSAANYTDLFAFWHQKKVFNIGCNMISKKQVS